MNVPVSSAFANQFRAREEAEKVEKEKLKQLTLNINERIEQEELAELIHQSKMSFYASANTNRERHQKYNHPKGAPDVDLIFGGSGSSSGNLNKRLQNIASSNLPNSVGSDILARSQNDMNKNFPNITSTSSSITNNPNSNSTK